MTGAAAAGTPAAGHREWWWRAQLTAGSPLAVHWLAYIGVLLLFVGVFGLVAFAFSDVAIPLRPVAELVAAAAPFAAAALLLRRGAVVVGRALEVVGGLLLPVLLVTSTVDDSPFPPDLSGWALAGVLAATCAATAGGYALWVRRHPDSGLRFAVGPALWIGAAMGAIGLGRAFPDGSDVAVPGSLQLTVVATVLVLTLAVARARRTHPLAGAVLTSGVWGTVVVAALAVPTLVADGLPAVPVLLLGALLVLATDLCGSRIPVTVAEVAKPVAWALALLGATASLVVDLGGSRAASVLTAVGATGFLVLLEAAGARHRPARFLLLPGIGLGTLLMLTVAGEPGPAAALLGATACWAAVRRSAPWSGVETPRTRAGRAGPSGHAAPARSAAAARSAGPTGYPGPTRYPAPTGYPGPTRYPAPTGSAVPLGLPTAPRYPVPPRRWSSAPALDTAALVLPWAALVALASATEPVTATLAATGVVAAATLLAVRPVLRTSPDDRFWLTWWRVGLLLAALAAAGAAPADDRGRWGLVLAVAAVAVVAVVGPLPARAKVWVVSALGLQAWFLTAAAASLTVLPSAVVPTVAGLGLLAVAQVRTLRHGVPAVERRPLPARAFLPVTAGGRVTGSFGTLPAAPLGAARLPTAPLAALHPVIHAAFAGHALTLTGFIVLAAVPSAPTGVARTTIALVAGLVVAGLAATAVADDVARSPLSALVREGGRGAQLLPWLLTALGLPLAGWLALDASGVRIEERWSAAVPTATAVLYAVAARARGSDRRATAVTGVALAAALLAPLLALSVTTGDAWPMVVGLAALPGSVVLLPASRRPEPVTWPAWATLVPIAHLVAVETWPWFAALAPTTAIALTLVAVGGALLVTAWAVDLAGRPWAPRWVPARRALWPPTALGALSVTLGAALAVDVPETMRSTLVLATAALVLATALLARVGPLAGVAAAVAWVAVLLRDPDALVTVPWTATAVAAGLLGVAELLHRLTAERRPAARWDVPLALAAALPALTGLAVTADRPTAAAVWLVTGLVAEAVAVRLRHHLPAALVVGTAGAAVTLVGADAAGPGVLALVLLAHAAAFVVLAERSSGAVRATAQVGALTSAVAAWTAMLAWLDWPAQTAVDVTILVAAVVAAATAVATRALPTARSWWLGTGTVGLLGVGGLALGVTTAAAAAPVGPTGWTVLAVVVAAGSAGSAAAPLRLRGLRDTAALGLLGAVLVAFVVAGSPAEAATSLLAVLAAALAAVVLGLGRRAASRTPTTVPPPRATWPDGPWLRPLAVTSLAATVAATATALPPAADPLLLTPLLGAAAVQAAVGGVLLTSLGLQVLSPVLACAAWLLVVDQTVRGGVQWSTAPIGLTMLVVVGLWRRDRRLRGGAVASTQVVALELLGIGFLAAPPLLLAIVESVWQAGVAVLVGLAVAGWGALTRVRRRVAAGALVVVTGLVLMVAVPLVGLIPARGGAGLWLLLAGLGVVAVVVATFLEKGRIAVRLTRARLEQATEDWE